MSPEAYKLIRNPCAPTEPKSETFAELKSLIKEHLCPKPSEAMKRYRFHQTRQTFTESVADYVARLKNLAYNCEFSNFKEALRDQLVCGLRSEDTRTEIFKEEKLTYDSAYTIAFASERAIHIHPVT
ncbi:uncharacterized protein [Neodiprion pinetum]|uniref:uncharacterized protein n=1 Tax=Neodiprion pinetum TaxID=441929 RepID=UPI003720F47A